MNTPIITSSPHISSKNSTTTVMLDVIIALLPALAASVWFFGMRAAIVVAVCVVSCVAFEALWCVLMKKPIPVGDLSAVVSGMLLAYNLPSGIPYWQAVLGSLVAIVVVKQLFGGLGCNFVNPALVGRVVMAVSFTSSMVNYSELIRYTGLAPVADILTSATPLAGANVGSVEGISLLGLFLGEKGGVLGETSCAALLLGGIYLCARKVIKPIIPVAFIGSTFIFQWLFGCPTPQYAVMCGGLFLGAIFMATDYVTSPYTNKGKWIFGIGCGLLTAVIRMFANSAEGVSFSILIMNLLVPYINGWTRRNPYGTEDLADER